MAVYPNFHKETFWVEQLPGWHWEYRYRAAGPCPANGEEHSAVVRMTRADDDKAGDYPVAHCVCGLKIPGSPEASGTRHYKDVVSGAVYTDKLPAGALYCASSRYAEHRVGYDGKSIVCVLPGDFHWYIDGSCSNCTLPHDRVHKCWVRHGTVGERIHVDKQGLTCAAGAGSIDAPGFHGFLHYGVLKSC